MTNKRLGRGQVSPVLALLLGACLLPVACDGGSEPPEPTDLSLSPSTILFDAIGNSRQVTATIHDQKGQGMSGIAITWASSAPSVASVSTTGLVTAIGNGAATITAQAGAVSGSVSVTVDQKVTAINVLPGTSTLTAIGETVQLVAEALDANQNLVQGTDYAWSSSDIDCVTVDSNGLVTAVGTGSAAITAEADSETGSAQVTVEQSVAQVQVSPESSVLSTLGETVQLSASALDANQNPIPDADFVWSSSDEGVATVSAGGLVAAVANGSATITATAGGESGHATVVVDAPPQTILYLRTHPRGLLSTDPQPPGWATLLPGDWTALLEDDLPAGTVEFSIWLKCPYENETGSFDFTLLARGEEPERVLATNQQSGTTPSGGGAVQLTGTLQLQTGVTAGEKLILRVESMTHRFWTVYGGPDYPSRLVFPEIFRVSRVPVQEVLVAPPSMMLDVGEEERLTVTLVDLFGDTLSESWDPDWETSDASVATVDNHGDVRAQGAGQATVTATVDGVVGSSAISVFDQTLWKYPAGDTGYTASAALGEDGTIYVAGDHLLALNPDGTLKWEYASENSNLWTPAIGPDGTLYAGEHTASGRKLMAIDSDGALKWERIFEGASGSSSPAVGSDGTVYFRADLDLFALSPEGSEEWVHRFWHSSITWGSFPPIAIGADGTLYFLPHDGELQAISRNGTPEWSFNPDGEFTSAPAIGADGTIYQGSVDGYLYAINPYGHIKWRVDAGSRVASSPAIAADGTVYVVNSDGRLCAFSPTGSLKWELDLGGGRGTWGSSPAVGADRTIYVGQGDRLYAVTSDGVEMWHVHTGDEILASPTLAPDGTLYVGSEDGFLYAIQTDSPGLANSPWPKYRHDVKNTGNVSGG